METCEFHCGTQVWGASAPGEGWVVGHRECLLYWLSLRDLRALVEAGVVCGMDGGWAAPDWLPDLLSAWDKFVGYDSKVVDAVFAAQRDAQARSLLEDDPAAGIGMISALRAEQGV